MAENARARPGSSVSTHPGRGRSSAGTSHFHSGCYVGSASSRCCRPGQYENPDIPQDQIAEAIIDVARAGARNVKQETANPR